MLGMEVGEVSEGVKCITATEQKRLNSKQVKSYLSRPSTILIAFFIVALCMNGGFQPFITRGFFCNDTSIRYPYVTSTVSFWSLLFAAFVVPGVIIKFCERTLTRVFESSPSISRRRRESGDCREVSVEEENLIPTSSRRRFTKQIHEPNVDISGLRTSTDNDSESSEEELFTRISLNSDKEQSDITRPPSIQRGHGFSMFFFGLTTTIFLTGLGKMTSGRLRPHFIHQCDPDVDCNSSENINRYIELFTCKKIPIESRSYYYITTSWPSGHASMIFYSMLYLAIYLHNVTPVIIQKIPNTFLSLCGPLFLNALFILMLTLAGYVSMTRISDYHHHPLDVVSGTILGCLVAFVLTRSLPKQYT